MNKQSPAEAESRQDSTTGSPTAGAAVPGAATSGTSGASGASATSGTPATGTAGAANQAVLGPFTVRDLTVFGAGLILFIASLLPLFAGTFNLWNLGSLFSLGLGILLPLIVVALFVARRLSPQANLRIGSLSIDQFASVTASYTLGFFFLAAAASFEPTLLLGLLGALVLFAATVLGRFIPYFAGDFLNRAEVPAHLVARDAAAPVRKPRAPKAAKAATTTEGSGRAVPASQSVASGAAATWKAAAAKTAAAVASVTGKGDAENSGSAKKDHAGAGNATSDAGTAAGAASTGAFVGTAAGTPAAASGTASGTAASAPASGQAAAAAPAAAGAPTAASAVVPPHTEDAQAASGASGAAQHQDAAAGSDSALPATTVNPQVRKQEPIGATVDPAHRPEEQQPAYEAFWFAVAQPRTAVDPRTGAPAFVIEPGGWVLALEDRGHEFLVQHTDGRVGILRDLSNIERG
ncbi:hypothetical protein V1639_03415 [Pseudarthrobacter sp. J75]|uniref:hypothetical protein n=1 Tax=unclassified Pseudarthrobacter TaxID=2647000 RepID=UPI002E81EC30|nr:MULTISPECIES: hypothetical protein [unclassified Pseudarthrobacter]MEE2522276.1 hypothetical protein [Pseudarthrobacter sp. J47]MEE2528078.1 hypothetical protein [Pseudarthrobacter sp. J75]